MPAACSTIRRVSARGDTRTRRRPGTDGPALDEASPLRHVEKVGAPPLIAHGNLDRRVQYSQSREMVALEAAAAC